MTTKLSGRRLSCNEQAKDYEFMRIIGSLIDCHGAAERKLYSLLKSVDTKNFTAIFNLSRLGENWESDIILIGIEGIFVFEIKGGRVYRDSDGYWYSTDRDDEDHPIKDPIFQAKKAKFHVMDIIADVMQLPADMYSEGVILPDTDMDGKNTGEYASVLDKSFLKDPQKTLEKLASQTLEKRHSRCKLSNEDIDTIIRKALVPKLGLVQNISRTLKDNESEMTMLNDEQYEFFSNVMGNKRVAISGPAGSGKTILALRAAQQNEQNSIRTLVVCYNLALAGYLTEAFDRICPNNKFVHIANLDNFIADSLGDRQFETELGSIERSEAFLNHILGQDTFQPFQELIIDEAQDSLREIYINALDIVVKGGLSDGRWLAFLDANQGGIYETSPEDFDADRILQGMNYFKVKLTKNMRNTKEIVKWTHRISGISAGKANNISGAKPEVISYTDQDSQAEQVKERINRLITKDGFIASEISVVSPLSRSRSLASTGKINQPNYDLEEVIEVEWSNINPRAITYGTARNYKGLENRVIIVTDLDVLYVDDLQNKLNYISTTRAKDHLVLFMSRKAKKIFDKQK